MLQLSSSPRGVNECCKNLISQLFLSIKKLARSELRLLLGVMPVDLLHFLRLLHQNPYYGIEQLEEEFEASKRVGLELQSHPPCSSFSNARPPPPASPVKSTSSPSPSGFGKTTAVQPSLTMG